MQLIKKPNKIRQLKVTNPQSDHVVLGLPGVGPLHRKPFGPGGLQGNKAEFKPKAFRFCRGWEKFELLSSAFVMHNCHLCNICPWTFPPNKVFLKIKSLKKKKKKKKKWSPHPPVWNLGASH